MPIIACGVNHKTAPIALREKVFFAQEKIPFYLNDLVNNEGISEVVLLSTCNRTELYCYAEDMQKVLSWFCRQHAINQGSLSAILYCHTDEEAVRHIMSVACGLDSLVLGEPEILGQMKQAFSESCAAGSVGTLFHRLFQQVFSVAKEVRSTTSIGACPVSVASTAIHFLKKVFAGAFDQATLLLIGAGDTIQLMLNHLKTNELKKLWIVNRDEEKAQQLAKHAAGQSFPFEQLPKLIKEVDMIVSATASTVPVITKDMISARKDRPLLLMDLAVPRDIEESVTQISGVRLFTIDDLKTIVQQHMYGREHASEKARDIINQKSREFIVWLQSIDKVAFTIRAYRKQVEQLRDEQLIKALRQLEQNEDPARVLTAFAYALTNKLLHAPTVQLRQAGVEGRLELLELAQQLFSIPELEAS